MIRKMICGVGALGTSLFAATAAFAQEAAEAASDAAAAVAAPVAAAVEPVAEPVLTEDEQVPAEAAAETERQSDA